MFVSDLTQLGGISMGTPISGTNKTDHLDITEMVLKWAIKHDLKIQIKSLIHLYYVLIPGFFKSC